MTDSPVQPQSSTFYIDPDYADFVPGKTQLKFKSLYDQRHPITLLILAAIGVPLLLMSPFLIALPFYEWSISQHPEVEATVIACEWASLGKSYIKLTYIFSLKTQTDAQGIVTSSDYVWKQSYGCDEVPLGTVITVKYDPDSPKFSYISEARLLSSQSSQILFYGLVGCATIAGIFMLLLLAPVVWNIPFSLIEYVRAKRKYPRLRLTGVAIEGVVEAIKPRKRVSIGGQINKNREYRVRVSYRFTAPDGSSHTGVKRFYCHEGRLPLLPTVGTPMKILYAADNCHVML